MTKDEYQQGINFSTQTLADFVESQFFTFTLVFVAIMLFAGGLFSGFYLYFISQRRLGSQMNRQEKQ